MPKIRIRRRGDYPQLALWFFQRTGTRTQKLESAETTIIDSEFMKNIILTLTALALCLSAQAGNHTLTTTDGDTYTGITLARVEPDGLYIEYSIPGGGIGMSKVKFDRLNAAQQKQFNYSRSLARDYEAAVTQANDDAAQDLIHRAQVERDAQRQRDLENERAYPSRMVEITRLNAAQAALFYRTTAAEHVPTSSLIYGTDFTAGHPTSQTSYAPATPDIFPNRNVNTVTTKTH